MEDKVCIVIKVANNSSDDQKIEVDLTWTVYCLKTKISMSHPVKPAVKDQKLIYSGHLLQDETLLKDALRHTTENNEYIIHLVCFATKHSMKTKNITTNNIVPDRTTNQISDATITVSSNSTFDTTSVYSQIPQTPNFASQMMPFQAISDPVQQMAMMQQWYAQYMTSYIQYMQTGSTDITNAYNLSTANASSNQLTHEETPREQANRQNNQIQVNAPLDEEEEGLRDWLDYLYFGSRLFLILSVVYFYSTLSRFFLVASAAVFLYMYQYGWFRAAAGAENRVQRQNENLVNQAGQAENMERNSENRNESSTSDESVNSNLTPTSENTSNNHNRSLNEANTSSDGVRLRLNALSDDSNTHSRSERNDNDSAEREAQTELVTVNEPQGPSFLMLSWAFISNFFLSILPEDQQAFI